MAEPLSLAASIAGLISLGLDISQITRKYVRGVRRAPMDVKELLQELTALVKVLRQFSELLDRDRIGEANFDQTSVLFLAHEACREELRTVRSKLLSRTRGHSIIRALTWPLVKKEHQQTIAAIHRWVQIFQFALTIDGCTLLTNTAGDVVSVLRSQLQTLEETKKIAQVVPILQRGAQEASTCIEVVLDSVALFSNTGEDMFNVKENVETLKRLALDDQLQKAQKSQTRVRQKLLEWLSPLESRSKQLDVLSRRSPSTGEWLLKKKDFQIWLSGKGPSCLWCSGIPGAGKTILTSIVVDHLLENPPNFHTAVGYIYFDYKDKDTQNVSAVFSSILRQLLERIRTIPQEIQHYYDSLPPERRENSLDIDQCVSFIQLVCKKFESIFLVFDALDECPVYDINTNELRSKMISTIERVSHCAAIFITSRPHLELAEELRECTNLEVRATDSDMHAYLKARTASHAILGRIFRQDPGLESHLIETICNKSNGMFLLARLQMDSLINQTSARNMYRALDRLPEKLNETFDDAMNRIDAQPDEHSILANQVISWIFYAKRPLQVAELRDALAIEPEDTRLDQSGCHDVQLSLDVCCGLVSIDEQDNVIRLVHYSFQQYLEDHWKTDCPGSNSGIATICLTYLTLDDFSPDAMEDTNGPTARLLDATLSSHSRWKDYHRFFSYVASHWAEHVKGSLEKELESLIIRFFRKKVHLLYGLQEYNKLMFRNLDYDSWPHEPSPLHLSAYWGLSHITNVLVGQGADVHAEDAKKRTPLTCAALNGQVDVARDLLGLGASANARDSSAATPLHGAVINDHFEVARVLLERGSDANAQNMDGSTPMTLAVSNGNLSMMDLLLQKGAEVEKIGERGLSPLEIAGREGHTAAIQWLLMRGADINHQNACPLVEAMFANQPHIVRILQDAGANINAMNQFGYTALGAAVKQGNMTIVQRLVNAGADVGLTMRSLADGTPLQMAAFKGDEALVSLLLYHGANVHARGGELGTVLQTAIYSQNIDVVKTILRQSPDVNTSAGSYGTTPLQLAVLLRDPEILTELLASNANPNIPSSFGIMPLHYAVYLGWETGIEKLLRHGANPEAVDLYGQSCFDSAHPDKKILRTLTGKHFTYIPTKYETQKRRLKQAVKDLATALLPDPNRRDGRRLDYHHLGHCLLKLTDIDEARTSFEQQIVNVFSKHEPRHNILCQHCDSDEIIGSRFVCFLCPDVDLCSTHMSQYLSNSPDPRCKAHQFLKVPGSKWKNYGNSKVNDLGETANDWLARLILKYGDADNQGSPRTKPLVWTREPVQMKLYDRSTIGLAL